MNKKKYIDPEIEVIVFTDDVIATSAFNPDPTPQIPKNEELTGINGYEMDIFG